MIKVLKFSALIFRNSDLLLHGIQKKVYFIQFDFITICQLQNFRQCNIQNIILYSLHHNILPKKSSASLVFQHASARRSLSYCFKDRSNHKKVLNQYKVKLKSKTDQFCLKNKWLVSLHQQYVEHLKLVFQFTFFSAIVQLDI